MYWFNHNIRNKRYYLLRFNIGIYNKEDIKKNYNRRTYVCPLLSWRKKGGSLCL